MTRHDLKGGFTLVEMMVVLAMIMILAGALTSSVAGARERAKIAAATVAVQEMTKAILMYENYATTHDLSQVTMEDREADESSLGFILGNAGDTDAVGNAVPVLYNAALRGGKILDPWGKAYRVTIRQGTINAQANAVRSATRKTSTAMPNFYRRNPEDPD